MAYPGSAYVVDCTSSLPRLKAQLAARLGIGVGAVLIPLAIVGCTTVLRMPAAQINLAFVLLFAVAGAGCFLVFQMTRYLVQYRGLEKLRIMLSSEGVDYETDSGAYHIRWDAVRSLELRKRLLAIPTGPHGGPVRTLLIPDTALLNPREFANAARRFGGKELKVR